MCFSLSLLKYKKKGSSGDFYVCFILSSGNLVCVCVCAVERFLMCLRLCKRKGARAARSEEEDEKEELAAKRKSILIAQVSVMSHLNIIR